MGSLSVLAEELLFRQVESLTNTKCIAIF